MPDDARLMHCTSWALQGAPVLQHSRAAALALLNMCVARNAAPHLLDGACVVTRDGLERVCRCYQQEPAAGCETLSVL